VQLTDAHPHSGNRIMRNLKMSSDYYNRKQRTLFDFFSDSQEKGVGAALADRRAWGEMRMMPTDIEDLQGFTPLINGMSPDQNWTGLFEPGERVRLRFINSSAMTYFDVRIPGLKMTVVQADGNNVQPVVVDEFRIAVAETYDVIVRPREDKAFTIFAESMGRTAYARGTLAPRAGMEAEVPELRESPLLSMADMGMAHEGMDHGGGMHTMADGTVMSGESHEDMGHGSENRHGRFRDSDILRKVFEAVVRQCMVAGLVKGEGFAVDAQYLAALDGENAPTNPERAPKALSPTDPRSSLLEGDL
jgi:L-ascorbate oxidase